MTHSPLLNGYFVSGSDTSIGKTFISQQLIVQMNQAYPSVKVRKPVESGCVPDKDGNLLTDDGLRLFQANKQRETLEIVTPYRFKAALAPNKAAQLENTKLTLDNIEKAIRYNLEPQDTVLVEGAGGIYSPIADDGFNIDLAARLGLKIILVIEDRLGAINQAMMALNAVTQKQLDLHAIILNVLDSDIDESMQNRFGLQRYTDIPVYHCPYHGKITDNIFPGC